MKTKLQLLNETLVVHQNPADLVLSVTSADLTGQIRILQQQTAVFDNIRFTFYIIGESHIVRVEKEDTLLFQEILACIDLPESGCLHHHRFDQMTAHSYHCDGYQVRVDFSPVSEALPPSTIKDALEVTFPEMYGQIPVTRIQWQHTGDFVQWWTLHSYPNETATQHVYTFSSFSLQKGFTPCR